MLNTNLSRLKVSSGGVTYIAKSLPCGGTVYRSRISGAEYRIQPYGGGFFVLREGIVDMTIYPRRAAILRIEALETA